MDFHRQVENLCKDRALQAFGLDEKAEFVGYQPLFEAFCAVFLDVFPSFRPVFMGFRWISRRSLSFLSSFSVVRSGA